MNARLIVNNLRRKSYSYDYSLDGIQDKEDVFFFSTSTAYYTLNIYLKEI
jgi:hypothetical protein